MGVDKHFFYVKDLSKKMFLIKLIIKHVLRLGF